MCQNEFFKEIFDYPRKEFIKHLKAPNNDRILFSGKFGIGKTSFLRNFFNEENQTKNHPDVQYVPIHLFPVNYSVSSNEDIVKYLKYDIIIELVKLNIMMEEIDLSFMDTLSYYAQQNAFKIAASLLFMVPKIGKDLDNVYSKLEKIGEAFLKYHKAITKNSADFMVEYLEKLELSEGSIYENDIITRYISSAINQIRDNDTRKVILVIDDLDRLDPEHVFRLFNVFAAHFDNYEKDGRKNKFGFDKVLFVCDVRNIRNIFQHKYGVDVDFNGYIDKFYSTEVYHFDNKRAINSILVKILNSIVYLSTRKEENRIKKLLFEHQFILNALEIFIQLGIINLRVIINLKDKVVDYENEEIILKSGQKENIFNNFLILQFKFLSQLLGDYEHLKIALNKTEISGEIVERYNQIFPSLIYIISLEKHKFGRNNPYHFLYENNSFMVNLYEDSESKNIGLYNLGTPFTEDNKMSLSPDIFWKACLDAIKVLNAKGVLN